MNVNCIICSDLFTPSDEIFATRCGHAFHQTCLLQWMERSKSCPQCRTKTTDKTIFRIYFNLLNTEGITLDAGSLQAKLDNVEFQLKQKDKEIKQQKDENQKLQQQCSKSEETLLSTKDKLKTKEVAIIGLKEQVDYLKVECKEVTQLRNEKEKLQNNVILLKGLEQIIYGTASEVEEMVKCQTDMTAMCTYVTALKRASTDLHNKKKRLQENVRALQNQLSKASNEKMDQQTKMVTLEESLLHAEIEIKQLKTKVNELESRLQSNSSNNKDIQITIHEEISPDEKCKRKYDSIEEGDPCSPPKSRKLNNEANEELQLKNSKLSLKLPDPDLSLMKSVKSTKESQSPYLNLKRNSALAGFQLKKSVSAPFSTVKTTEFSIFKTNRLSEKMKSQYNGDLFKPMLRKRMECKTTYDGLGGHSRLDIFPVATKKHQFTTTVKKLPMKDKLKRLERPANQATIDNTFKKK